MAEFMSTTPGDSSIEKRVRSTPESIQPSSRRSLARENGSRSDRYVGALMPLAFLAPEIVAQILSGTQPIELTAASLMRRAEVPLAWTDQRTLLGID